MLVGTGMGMGNMEVGGGGVRRGGVHSVTLKIMMHYQNIRSNELKDGKSKKHG